MPQTIEPDVGIGDLLVEDFSFRCWEQTWTLSFEQLEPGHILEPLQRTADGGLGHPKQLGPARCGPGPHDRIEGFDQTEVHGSIITNPHNETQHRDLN